MNEEFFADACADVFGCNPQMLQFGSAASDYHGVEADNLAFMLRNIDLIVADEIRGDREVGLPVLNPMLGVPPVALSIVGDLRQGRGFLR